MKKDVPGVQHEQHPDQVLLCLHSNKKRLEQDVIRGSFRLRLMILQWFKDGNQEQHKITYHNFLF